MTWPHPAVSCGAVRFDVKGKVGGGDTELILRFNIDADVISPNVPLVCFSSTSFLISFTTLELFCFLSSVLT